MSKIIFLFLFCFSLMWFLAVRVSGFPGDPYSHFTAAYGDPVNLNGRQPDQKNQKYFNYYWTDAEADILLAGKKLKGNLIILFENQGAGNPDFQGVGPLNLRSSQETLLAQITADNFKMILERLAGNWKVISKASHQNASRAYDLYQLVSNDRRYRAEISYSRLEAIVSPRSGQAPLQTPLFNLWIHTGFK